MLADEERAHEIDVADRAGAVLFVPCTDRHAGEHGVQLALKPLEDGRLAMLVFTSLDLLVAGCGEQQPWVALSETQVEEAFYASSADVVAVDAGLTPEQRWGAGGEPQDLETFRAPQASVTEVSE